MALGLRTPSDGVVAASLDGIAMCQKRGVIST